MRSLDNLSVIQEIVDRAEALRHAVWNHWFENCDSEDCDPNDKAEDEALAAVQYFWGQVGHRAVNFAIDGKLNMENDCDFGLRQITEFALSRGFASPVRPC